MIPSHRRAAREKHAEPRRHAGWLTLTWCLGMAIVSPPASAQAPTASREELMRQWDINRDGKVDTGEAEIARSRMRRVRNDALWNSGTDPVTGRPRVVTDPVTGRPVPTAEAADGGSVSAPADDDGLILVPGNGERPGSPGTADGGSAARTDVQPRPSRRDREALPGTRAPTMSSTIPSVAPRPSAGGALPGESLRSPGTRSPAGMPVPTGSQDAAHAELSSSARLLPGMSSQQNPGPRDPQSARAAQERTQPAARPGIIAGGARPGMAASRSASGGGKPGDLNAGRLPGGLPQTRGTAPGSVAAPRPGSAELPNAGRMAGPVPSVPRPGTGPYRGPTAPSVQSPSVPRPGVRQPDGGRPVTRVPNTVPRVPRMTTDEFYGR